MGTGGNGLPVAARERLERIVIQIVGIAAQPGIDADLRNELMQLADQISLLLET